MALLTDIKSDSGFVPSGCVFPFAGSSAPTGWLLCDGAEYSTTAYANLFSAISTTYATQINPTTGVAWAAPAGGNFRVPDLRGVFLRGAGAPSGTDTVTLGAIQTHKTAATGLSNASSATSSVTTGSYSHNHSITWYGNGSAAQGTGTAAGDQATPLGGSSGTGVSTDSHSHTVPAGSAAAQVPAGYTETRPLNRGVNYIIKI